MIACDSVVRKKASPRLKAPLKVYGWYISSGRSHDVANVAIQSVWIANNNVSGYRNHKLGWLMSINHQRLDVAL